MADDIPVDHYDVLQISVNAEPETVHRVYRILAQRYHPDNAETGNDHRFRQIAEAYRVLSDPVERARFDAQHDRQQQERWRLITLGASEDDEVEVEQRLRTTVLEVLFTKRRVEPQQPGVFHGELEKLTGRPHEHLEFTIWYLVQKKLVQRTDNSLLAITVEGIDYLEDRSQSMSLSRRLAAVNTP
jgi:curved DNA-binding protein CbpA